MDFYGFSDSIPRRPIVATPLTLKKPKIKNKQ